MAHTLLQVAESVGTITLDHERRRNALSHALVEEVITALQPTSHRALVSAIESEMRPGESGRPTV